MTIIAFDGQHLVADRVSSNGAIQNPDRKLTVPLTLHERVAKRWDLSIIDQYIYASVGAVSTAVALHQWMVQGLEDRVVPVKEPNSLLGLLLNINNGLLYVITGGLLADRVDDPVLACGSAKEVAYGVMWFGGSAIDAVKVCVKHCNNVGGGYDAYVLTEAALRRRQSMLIDAATAYGSHFTSVDVDNF